MDNYPGKLYIAPLTKDDVIKKIIDVEKALLELQTMLVNLPVPSLIMPEIGMKDDAHFQLAGMTIDNVPDFRAEYLRRGGGYPITTESIREVFSHG